MRIEAREVSTAALAEYAQVPIAFEVHRVLDVAVQNTGLGGILFSERRLQLPYVKDYDAIDGGPAHWARHFDLSNWGLFAAYSGGQCVGGAAVAFDSADLDMLEGRSDLAVLWDIRVSPGTRGKGIGTALFQAAAAWAAERDCHQLKAETQNINVPACTFYAREGCVLGGLHRFAYPELPDEVQLLWYKDLPPP